jgi:hypothetical protein
LHKLWNEIGEIGTDLHSVSHRLHSSTLETLGLTAGVRSFCAELSSQHAIEVEFVYKGIPKSTNPETALCLFRIVQGGLRNVRKHSRTTKVDVWLQGSAEAISLTLSDNGVGFKLSDCVASLSLYPGGCAPHGKCTTYCCIRGEPADRLRYFNSVEFFDHTGLAAFGPPGVEAVLEILLRELKTIMRQAGTASIGQITNKSRFWTDGRQSFPYPVTEGLPII